VPFDAADMQDLLAEIDTKVGCDRRLSYPDHIFTAPDVADAIKKLNSHKNDGSSNGVSTDHLLHAGPHLPTHAAYLSTRMVIPGYAPKEFGVSVIIPIPKKRNINAADSNNFRDISLSSVFCKVFDNII
jgi:hypothetical protein